MISKRKRNNDCSLETSKDDKHAGIARDVQAECKYNGNMKKYYYEISWKPPFFQKKPVSRYRVVIMYDITKICFQLSRTVDKLEFNKSVGFIHGRCIRFAVTPEPVIRVGGKFTTLLKKSGPCPPPPANEIPYY